jgi:hypothetical protein
MRETMDKDQARIVAARFLAEKLPSATPLALFDNDPEDRGWCFLFYWNTAEYVRTRDIAFNIGPGTGPIAVVKATADAWALGSASFDAQLDDYARRHGIAV